MIFNIPDDVLLNKNIIKIINGIAGSGKSTQTVNQLNSLGESFCLASFSNALKFAAFDKFGCEVDTICGLEFVNSPNPRYAEKEVTEFSTVINDEILLDGLECINWMKHNVGKTNIIALTDSRQMLSADNSSAVLKAFESLCKRKDVICVEVSDTKRARTEETKEIYNKLYGLNSRQIFTLKEVSEIYGCEIISFDDISFDEKDTYICHSNAIEHEIYKRFGLSTRRDICLIPKNSISRKREFDPHRYPICDQITATDKNINAYLQAANVATPTRYQGKEVEQGRNCYYVVEPDSLFVGREVYTVGTRCQDINSMKIVLLDVHKYEDPKTINKTKVVEAKRLNVKMYDGEFTHCNITDMSKLVKQYGEDDIYYKTDFAVSGDKVIASTLHNFVLSNFADIVESDDSYEVTIRRKRAGARRTIKSIVKNDPLLHFDFMPKIYSIIKTNIRAPRIQNPTGCKKSDFSRLCDIYSAFPTILHFCDMPCSGFVYEEYDPELLNFYIYEGDKVSKGALITEVLAKRLGDSRYVFSTGKQKGCSLGHYTYEQCTSTKEKKKQINEIFKWGQLESSYYKKENVCKQGQNYLRYVKYENNTNELIACALWSELCNIMFGVIEELNLDKYVVVTDGIYYDSDKIPSMPDWCYYRVEDLNGKEKNKEEKYTNIIYKNYKDPFSASDIKLMQQKERREKKKRELEAIRSKA